MDDQQEGCGMPDFDDLEARLREHRYRASGLELDEIKQRAIARAMRSRTTGAAAFAPRRKGNAMRSRLIAGIAGLGLLVGGTGGVLAASGGGGGGGNAAQSQYCPPQSPGAGKPKHQPGGNKCGQPDSVSQNH